MSIPAERQAGTELLERAVSYTRGTLELVTDERLTRPTPCTGWDLRRLLEHMGDSLEAFAEAATGRVDVRPRPAATSRPSAGALVDDLRGTACQLLGWWTAQPAAPAPPAAGAVRLADRTLATGLVAAAGALEISVHGWDVAAACGEPRPLPEPLARDLLAAATLLVSDADRPSRFAPPLTVPPSAPAERRLLAWLGRPRTRPI